MKLPLKLKIMHYRREFDPRESFEYTVQIENYAFFSCVIDDESNGNCSHAKVAAICQRSSHLV